MKQNHVRLKTHLFQIPPWPKGYNFQLISLLSWFLKPVWLLCFPSRRDQLHVPSPCQQPRGYSWDIPMCTPRRGYSIRKRWSSLTWRKTHFLPMFTSLIGRFWKFLFFGKLQQCLVEQLLSSLSTGKMKNISLLNTEVYVITPISQIRKLKLKGQ